jgi:hypothetical protein
MFKIKYKQFIFLLFIFLNSIASAQTTESTLGAALPEKEFSGQQNEKWITVQKSLLELKIKVDAQKNTVADLLKSKKNNEAKISQEEIALLKKEYARLQSLTNDYNEMLVDFQFRFPEKGLESGRKYIRLENQSIEEMESTPTIQGRLKKLNKKIKKQYQEELTEPDQTKSKGSAQQGQKIPVGSKTTDTEKTTDVTEQIILVK